MELCQFHVCHVDLSRRKVVGVPITGSPESRATTTMEIPQKDLYGYLALLRRRRTLILTVTAALFMASAAFAFLLPPSYRSTATILIEEQEIPPDIVRSAITSYADQRIETIKQQ